ncbi:MAG TPA: HDOD domain-containing protein [Geobacteraceae bacterium]|nr:HDOD domain-containing protein [Geobacteraceae bacterium]
MKNDSMLAEAQQLVKGIHELPTIPEIATKVLDMFDRPDVELEELAETILVDQVMASRVIKIVNSPFFKPMHEIKSLKRALIYLGFRQIRHIALTCSIIDAFDGKSGVFDIKTFWEHSFGVGVVSKIIAQRIRYPEIEKAYIVGIVHDIGEVFLSYYMKDVFQKVVDQLQGTTRCFIEVEKQVLGTTHCELGFCLAKNWNFPSDYCDVIAHHHAPLEATSDPTLAAIVNLADLFCSVRHLDYGGREWVSFNLAEEPAWDILKNFSPIFGDLDVERFCYELDERVPEVQDLVNSLFEGMIKK